MKNQQSLLLLFTPVFFLSKPSSEKKAYIDQKLQNHLCLSARWISISEWGGIPAHLVFKIKESWHPAIIAAQHPCCNYPDKWFLILLWFMHHMQLHKCNETDHVHIVVCKCSCFSVEEEDLSVWVWCPSSNSYWAILCLCVFFHFNEIEGSWQQICLLNQFPHQAGMHFFPPG